MLEIDIDKLCWELRDELDGFLNSLIDQGGSDLHLTSGATPKARIHGEINSVSDRVLSRDDMVELCKVLTRTDFKRFVENKNIDFSYDPKTNKEGTKFKYASSFRVNLFFTTRGPSAVFRVIPDKMPDFVGLRLPSVLQEIADTESRGLILVTGPTGSGKTTTLASMLNYINHKFKRHIITIEDPIEFKYEPAQSIVNQRNIGQDAINFSDALRAALREDPDIILVGEMRDLETIEVAMHAAETGHLVLSTLHTINAQETINRILGMFPSEEQNRIRSSLSSVLRAVVSQRLCRTTDGKRTAAVEILRGNERIKRAILDYKENTISEILKDGTMKMQSFDQHLFVLYTEGRISEEEAYDKASNPSDLKVQIDGYKFANQDANAKVSKFRLVSNNTIEG
ncbi:type IV pilus twitching motility protein PilT [Campylobacter canadensis]|uniref:PilT/PilU family type 4a pilus ATPase n=1 Tax=Campylobacter canadensis TaxID=449520 RepID=A0ABS7WR14_9BACT|nr:PilT/PilU family type 4a pilus ATPase [Campylobacter canadensis]MBZ7987211.1 PilT/PilU family type 4a pilus ATPase [Campylobacter canadensis]MBZ7994437.1 PilT/PilU family type 4a pilus ATPase [Campylobacter canadensis]MBZ7996476.1 PilT/PilU family type 4a pilus ATPase [Campylobacter canadensis]MBZ7998165.1 PilT/PilU family type 4a pilus ATPase [Campylobacter canadensis]MBZ7999848.1 PilT/PilU family type 4a pilus ATPase [Campylobacter canadensis]